MAEDSHRSLFAVRAARPFATEAEFLEREGFALTASPIVLVGVGPRPEGVILRFELALEVGTILLRGEGRVIGHGPTPTGEPGLLLKFTRLDPRSKAFVDRATGGGRTPHALRSEPAPAVAPSSVPPRVHPAAIARQGIVPVVRSEPAPPLASPTEPAAPPEAAASVVPPASTPPEPAGEARGRDAQPREGPGLATPSREEALARLRARLAGADRDARMVALGLPPARRNEG